MIEGDYVYGICSYGQLRCLRRATGERIWETQSVTVRRRVTVPLGWFVIKTEYLF